MDRVRGDVLIGGNTYSNDRPKKNIGYKFLQFLTINKLIKFFRIIVRKTLDSIDYWILMSNNGAIFYKDDKKTNLVRKIKQIMKESRMLLRICEAYTLVVLVEKTGKIEGDIAELGTYRGGSARLICEAKDERRFHIFDTFEGLPILCKNDDHGQFEQGKFSSSYDYVKSILEPYPNVHLYKGLFPSTAGPIAQYSFSFVHLDADIYESTKEGLCFFYSRMSSGGMILSHDYTSSPGVRQAFDEFFADKSEHIIELAGSQCLVIKS
jgi:O-methyltransferase